MNESDRIQQKLIEKAYQHQLDQIQMLKRDRLFLVIALIIAGIALVRVIIKYQL